MRHTTVPIYVSVLWLAAATGHVAAQGISESTIVGADREVVERSVSPQAVDLNELLADSEDTADRIRLITDPDPVVVVQLGERRTVMTARLEDFLEDNAARLADLRNAVQINAVLFEVLNAKGVGAPEVVAAEVSDEDAVTIYAFTTQAPGN